MNDVLLTAEVASKHVQRIVVFVGPSFDAARVRELVPDVDVRAPIRRGGLDEIVAPATVAIIDGVFDAELAITTREIRAALARGVKIVGSSSMGAMRAVEVPGMVGVGRIYEMIRDGIVERDDEVAILIDADTGRALTEPLVNVRYAVESLLSSGSLGEDAALRIVTKASELHFHDRQYRNILRAAGFTDPVESETLIGALRSFDLKREDAHTLLERLHDHAARCPPPGVDDAGDAYVDHFDAVEVVAAAPANTPVMVWEYGERVEFEALVRFLAATGQLAEYAARYPAIDADADAELAAESATPSVQELFDEAMGSWGWRSPEEVHVTLSDLGIGFDELQSGLRTRRRQQVAARAACASPSDAWLRTLRVALFLDDLSLKRAAMRLGALRFLAARAGGGEPTPGELDDARRALLSERPEVSWQGLLAESGATDTALLATVSIVAQARRVGMPLLERMMAGRAPSALVSAGVVGLPEAKFVERSPWRSLLDDDAERFARTLAAKIGITRIARVGELENFRLHVASAYRPSEWSCTLGSGKSETASGAVAGAVVEELEKYCQDVFIPDVLEVASLRAISKRADLEVIDPTSLALPYDSDFSDSTAIGWTWAEDLVSARRVVIPSSFLSSRRERNDALFSPRRGRKLFTSNGLAGSFSLTEAILHALCEKIERHAVKLAEQAISNPGRLPGGASPGFTFVDLATVPHRTRDIVNAVRTAGFEVRALDITSEVRVPTFVVRIMRAHRLHGIEDLYAAGSCTHANAELALSRAILEAVQTRVTSVSGAREDLGMKARSLGRHERPRPLSKGDAFWIRPSVPKKAFDSHWGCDASSAREALDLVVRRVVAAGFDRVLFRDLSRDELAPAKVARVFVPGMEDTNPFHTGERARVRIVMDLMQRHEW